MHVLSTWSVPSAVYFSAKLGETVLVLARASRIEVVRLLEDGLSHVCKTDLWGQITSLRVLNEHNILVTVDHPRPVAFLVSYDRKTSTLSVAHAINLYMRSDRISEYFQGAIVDPTSQLAVSLAYSSSVKVVQFSSKNNVTSVSTEFDARIPELNIISMCFVPTSADLASPRSPTIAILHIDSHLRRQLVARHFDLTEKELSADDVFSSPRFVDSRASLLIPINGVGGDSGGILAIGGGSCEYIGCSRLKDSASVAPKKHNKSTKGKSPSPELAKKRVREVSTPGLTGENGHLKIQIPLGDITAFDHIDDSRILVADTWGRVALLSVSRDQSGVSELRCVLLGEISCPATIVYLNNGIFYVGSHYGDCQLARLLPVALRGPDGKLSHVQILDVYKNVAPISDAVITESEGSAQVVACSGGFNSGSLRIMRKSADFKEHAVLEHINHVVTMWPLKVNHNERRDRFLMLSTLYDTILIDLGDGSKMEELDMDQLPDLIRTSTTIATGNVIGSSGHAIVQVTPNVVRVIDLASGFAPSTWPSEGDSKYSGRMITAASVNATQVLVAFQGGTLVYLTIDKDLRLIETSSRNSASGKEPHEISALSITPMWSTHPNASRVAAIAFWGSNIVSLVSLPNLTTLPDLGFAPSEAHLPKSLLFHTFGDITPFLLVGLADGTLAVYELDHTTFQVKGRRNFVLGHMPLRLTPCKHGSNQHVVFVSGSRPAIVFLENGRLQHSPIGLKDVSAACMLDSEAFPNSLVLSRENRLVVGQLETLHELQIRTIMFGNECPTRIAHDDASRMFGVAVIKTDAPPITGTDSAPSVSSLRLLDDTSFAQLGDYLLEPSDQITGILSYDLYCDGKAAKYWIIGSEVLHEIRSSGRLSVCALQQGGIISLVASVILPGAVAAVAGIDGKIAVVAGAGVAIFELTKAEHEHEPRLTQLSKWERGYHINQIVVQDDIIVMSDALRSINVLRWTGKKLELVARDHSSLWPITIGLLGSQEIFVAEGQGHIYTYSFKNGSIERSGAYYLGELVTEVRRGSVATREIEGDVEPSAVFFTNTGRIGVISAVPRELGYLFTSLERNLSHALPGPGGLEHAHWRAPVTVGAFEESSQTGFVDGDFVERFLDYGDPASAKVALEGRNAAQKINSDYAVVVQRLEQLQAVH